MKNMNIHPYVYMLTHRMTGQFYIGYRCANKMPAEVDLPKYKSSSKLIKEMGFDNFDWKILCEFDSGEEAYDFEQKLIKKNIDSPLCLNQNYFDGGGVRMRLTSHSMESIQKIKSARANQAPFSEETRKKMSEAKKGKPGRKLSPEEIENIKRINTGRIVTTDTRAKLAVANIGRKNPHSDETKRRMSEAKKGKKFSEEHKAKLSAAAKARCERQRLKKLEEQNEYHNTDA